MERKLTRFHLFNCDNTYSLNSVEALLLKMEDKLKLKIAPVEKHYFRLQQMTEICETAIPKLPMDVAIFVVHAHESRLSINEDNAGIGYAKFYKALLQATEGKVLIVIGGDDQYRDADEEERAVISRWARRKVASQFKEECLDGRESFIFSWNKQHREIHEEALLHYFDPRKKGQQFAFQPKPKPKLAPMPKSEEPKIAFPEAKDIQREPVKKDDAMGKLLPKDDSDRDQPKEEPKHSYGATYPVSDYPANTMLLDTRMRHGEISYDPKDVSTREDHWLPSENYISDLRKRHRSTYDAKVQFVSQGNGDVTVHVVDVTPSCWRTNRLLIGFFIVVLVGLSIFLALLLS